MNNCGSFVTLFEDENARLRVGCETEHIILGTKNDFKYHSAKFKSVEGIDVELHWKHEITTEINHVNVR